MTPEIARRSAELQSFMVRSVGTKAGIAKAAIRLAVARSNAINTNSDHFARAVQSEAPTRGPTFDFNSAPMNVIIDGNTFINCGDFSIET